MGIAFGSFAALRFRSDVSADGGDHAAQFWAPPLCGPTRPRNVASRACGFSFIPQSNHYLLTPHCPAPPPINTVPVRTLECSDTERVNKTRVRYEVDYWDLATTKERSAWHGLQDMWAAAPDFAREHYLATAEAINRMRIAQGKPPVANVRRRTLPRRRR